jgi:hypothetical protein
MEKVELSRLLSLVFIRIVFLCLIPWFRMWIILILKKEERIQKKDIRVMLIFGGIGVIFIIATLIVEILK